ncbi:DnaJ domain-containing protein [Sphingomonas sp. LHG3406-1]|uniref:J domain-containing protein n=1 Tax=Sphingomonas sp. LHG3406-1 TaxID=2804617 RepID=UPI00261544C1|nr:DnaJ domain-containing protein [Sphingomonas sp. LHG3406-1]
MPNHYRTLGVDPEADEATIRTAYLAMMRRYHPDTGGGGSGQARAQEIIAAYEILRDPTRRAAYDAGRRAVRQPALGGGGMTAGAMASSAARRRVRGGHVARNFFLLLAASTAGLAYWALQRPIGGDGRQVAARSTQAEPALGGAREPASRPPPSAVEEQPVAGAALPPVAIKPAAEPRKAEVALSPLPVVRDAEMPVRPAPPVLVEKRPVRSPPPLSTRAPVAAQSNAPLSRAVARDQPRIDLVGLERHLDLLTDQSLRHADEARRTRLSTTREQFAGRLAACSDDLCRRDAYLRRNQEVAEIMRR